MKATLRSERSEREAIDRVRLSLQTREDAIDSAEKVAKPPLQHNSAAIIHQPCFLYSLSGGFFRSLRGPAS